LLRDLPARIAAFKHGPPIGGDPNKELGLLTALWRKMVDHNSISPIADRAQRVERELAAMRQGVEAALDATMRSIFRRCQQLIFQGAEAPGIINSADFADAIVYVRTPAGGWWAAGWIGALPEGHHLKTILPLENYYYADGRPALVLGTCGIAGGGGRAPKTWYYEPDAVLLTKRLREEQIAEQRDRERGMREAQLQEQRLREQDPAYQLEQVKQRVRELEKREGIKPVDDRPTPHKFAGTTFTNFGK
jgi:hypothetical protein